MKELIMESPAEFSFQSNLAYLQRNKNECMYEIENGVITRIIEVSGDPILVQISSPENHDLHIQFLSETHTSQEKISEITHYLKDWFDLETNLTPFYELAQRDPLLEQAVKKNYGLRVIGIPDLFEALCWGVLGQQINLDFAYTLKRCLVEKYGETIIHNGKSYWSFPTCEKIAALRHEDLQDLKMTKRKSEYIIGIAQLMAQGKLSKDRLLELNDFRTIEKALINIRGIGPWTANYVLMRCLHFHEAFPIADIGLINSIKFLKGMERKPTKEEILEMAKPWKGWEAYATFYLQRAKY